MTNRQIKTLKGTGKRQALSVGDGVVLRVSPDAASKVFVWSFRRNGRKSKQEWITLGAFPALTLDAARAKAHAARQTLREGGEPGAVNKTAEREAADGPTFGDLIDYFDRTQLAPALATERDPKAKLLAATTAGEHRRRCQKFLSALRNRSAAALRFRDIADLCDPIVIKNGPQEANQVQMLISKIFNTAIKSDRGVEVNPCARRDLRAPRSAESDRALSDTEINNLFQVYTNAEQVYLDRIAPHVSTRGGGKMRGSQAQNYRDTADLLWLELLLGNRGGELQNMRWADLKQTDDGIVFVIPRHRNKTRKRDHRIPLSRQAVAVLETKGLSQPTRRYHKTYVFPNTTGTGPLVKPRGSQAGLF